MTAGNGTSVNNVLMASGKVTATNAQITSFTTAGLVHCDASGNMSSSTLINSDITDGTINDSKLNTISTAGKIANSATTATDASSASTIVLRNASGDTKVNNLSANTVLANSVKSVTSGNLDIQSNGMNCNLRNTFSAYQCFRFYLNKIHLMLSSIHEKTTLRNTIDI
ncbi:hypothetical protein PAPYR_11997 [Paratrimastix pyriformis]|uniref:Uncharacterized protein n=1 Tax=Paratrimastix pyriformis TaxID=342808 RepID=A0ABQ8U5C5_9EUKA|nr:hypothetical protein PAPYR_11997 [Paratrimastix pyriformis]